MRTTAAILLTGCFAALPVVAMAQTSILPSTATLNARNDIVPPHQEVARADVAGHAIERGRRGEARPPRGRLCLNQSEAREAIAEHRLIDPVRALRLGRQQGDALSAKLCRWSGEDYVYELNILRRDGRILRLFMNGRNGDVTSGQSQTGQVQTPQGGSLQPVPADVRMPGRER